ncbi:MAG: hypothetical protein ACREX9_15095 [Gammaproteobacteria bacterium]
MRSEQIYKFEESYERKRLGVQEAAEMLGVRADTLRYGSARYETEGLDPHRACLGLRRSAR